LNSDIDINKEATQAIQAVFADDGVRVIHLYKTFDPTEHLLMKSAVKPIFVFQPEVVFDGLLISKSIGEKDKDLSNKKRLWKISSLKS
jgi:hypothetical protein